MAKKARNINIFGTKFAYPKGLRKSPGSNAYNSCVAMKLSGQRSGSKAAQIAKFREAANACKGTRN